MVKAMQAVIVVDAAKAFKNGVTTSVNTSEAFGKNGIITYLKKIFDVIGVNTDQITTMETVKEGLEAESAKEYREAIKKLIEIASKY